MHWSLDGARATLAMRLCDGSGELDTHYKGMRQQARDMLDALTGPVAALG